MLFNTIATLSLALGATAVPMYLGVAPETKNQTWTKIGASPSMALKRSAEDPSIHPVVRSIQKVNYAMQRHAKRTNTLHKRAILDVRSFDFVPVRSRHLQPRRNGQGAKLTIVQILGQDQNGDIVCILSNGQEVALPVSVVEALTGATITTGNGAASGASGTASGTAAGDNSQPGAVVSQPFNAASAPTQAASVALNEDGADTTYFSSITIGSNNKEFLMVMDTGSSDLWVPAAGSTTTHSELSQADSTSLVIDNNKPFQITYGSGSVAGVLASDTVTIAGMTLNTTFGLSQQISSQFDNFQPDGILGLATSKASAEGVTVPLQLLADTNQIPAALIGVHLQRAVAGTNDGVINFGTLDAGFIKGGDAKAVTFSDNISVQGLWEIPLEDMLVGGKTLGLSTASTAIIDTGTTLMIVPPADAETIHAALGAAETNQAGTFTLPCDTTTSLAVKFGGQTLDISPLDYVGAPIRTGSATCVSRIMGAQIGGANQMLLGDVFLKNVYSVFDLDTNQVGFAPDAINA